MGQTGDRQSSGGGESAFRKAAAQTDWSRERERELIFDSGLQVIYTRRALNNSHHPYRLTSHTRLFIHKVGSSVPQYYIVLSTRGRDSSTDFHASLASDKKLPVFYIYLINAKNKK